MGCCQSKGRGGKKAEARGRRGCCCGCCETGGYVADPEKERGRPVAAGCRPLVDCCRGCPGQRGSPDRDQHRNQCALVHHLPASRLHRHPLCTGKHSPRRCRHSHHLSCLLWHHLFSLLQQHPHRHSLRRRDPLNLTP